jgi:saccharopine dehydrogenase (NADP+, L-glutamate forming)
MLGAGFVTRPTLDILSDAGIEVSVGTVQSSVHISKSS